MTVQWYETNGTLTNNAVPLKAASRSALIVSNNSDTVMYLRIGDSLVASATAGIPIQPGDSIGWHDEATPQEPISLFCAGTAKAYTIYERQFRS